MSEETDNKTIGIKKENNQLIHRLNRVEGQMHGISKMVSNDEHFNNLVVQVLAVNAALNSFSKLLVDQYLLCNVASDTKDETGKTADNLVSVLEKMIK